MLLTVITVRNVFFTTTGILIMGSSFEIPFFIVAMILKCGVLILVALLVSLIFSVVLAVIIHDINRTVAIHFLEYFVLDDPWYI